MQGTIPRPGNGEGSLAQYLRAQSGSGCSDGEVEGEVMKKTAYVDMRLHRKPTVGPWAACLPPGLVGVMLVYDNEEAAKKDGAEIQTVEYNEPEREQE